MITGDRLCNSSDFCLAICHGQLDNGALRLPINFWNVQVVAAHAHFLRRRRMTNGMKQNKH